MHLWRLCKARYAVTALTGEGARLYAGRWNPAGVPMVYTSTSKSLACLEMFVHLDPNTMPNDMVSLLIKPPKHVKVERLAESVLPVDWHSADHPILQKLGADWIASQRTVALQVPSAVVEGEWNVLLNPAHPDFAKLVVGEPEPFHFDNRMFRSS